MFILSNAMGKSASSVLHWYTRELLQTAFPENGMQKVRQLNAEGQFRGTGLYVAPLTDSAVDRLLRLSKDFGPIVIKSHSSLSPKIASLIKAGEIKATFSLRDPRDMVLSAIEHRKRRLAEGHNEFRGFDSVAAAMIPANWWCEMSCQWLESGLATVFRYKEIVANPLSTLKKIASTIGIKVDESKLHEILKTERQERSRGRRQFNKASLSRFPTEMDEDELALCELSIGHYIQRLGYPLTHLQQTNQQRKTA